MPKRTKQLIGQHDDGGRKAEGRRQKAASRKPELGREPQEPAQVSTDYRLPTTDYQPLIEEFRARYPFPLDPFQEEAIAHLAMDESVMVAAPTGTGKTVVAEFGVFRAARRGFKVMYTTPTKAPSKQQFRDLREQYGDAVGLLA